MLAFASAGGLALAQVVTDFPIRDVSSLATGPLGVIWFARGSEIGAISGSAQIRRYPVPYAEALTVDPSGNVWFTDALNNAIGRRSHGSTVEFPLPGFNSAPAFITAAPDGSAWFYEMGSNKIGRMSPGGQLQEFSLPPDLGAQGMAYGSDGAVWFTSGLRIGRLPANGATLSFAVPEGTYGPIVAGPDGALWFTTSAGVRRITTAGVLSLFPTPSPYVSIAAGPDALWLATLSTSRFARMTTSGMLTELQVPAVSGSQTLLTGPLAVGEDGVVYLAYFSFRGDAGVLGIPGDIAVLGSCSPVSEPPLDARLGRLSQDFESLAAGVSLEAASIPGLSFEGISVAASIQDTSAYPFQALSGKALVWTQLEDCSCSSNGIFLNFSQDVAQFRARYAVRAKYGQHGIDESFVYGGGSAFLTTAPTVADEPGFPGGPPFWEEGVLEFPEDLVRVFPDDSRLRLRRVGIGLHGFGDISDLRGTTLVLDNIEVVFAPPCSEAAGPHLTSPPSGDTARVYSGDVFRLTWSPAPLLSAAGVYAVETSWDCEFSSLLSSQSVVDTSTDLVIPHVEEGALLYVRVYTRDQCGPLDQLAGKGSAGVLSVVTEARPGPEPRAAIEPPVTRPVPRVVDRP